LEGVQNTFNLGWEKQNTSSKWKYKERCRKYIAQVHSTTNKKKPQLKVYLLGGRSNRITLNHQEYPITQDISTITTLTIHDISLLTELNHHEQKHNTGEKGFPKTMMISKRKKNCKEGPKSTMEGGHMLNKLHTRGTMKQQDQGSKRNKKRCRPMLSWDKN